MKALVAALPLAEWPIVWVSALSGKDSKITDVTHLEKVLGVIDLVG